MARSKKNSLINKGWKKDATENLISAGLTQAGVLAGAFLGKQIDQTGVVSMTNKDGGSTQLGGVVLQAIGVAGSIFLNSEKGKAVTNGIGAYGAVKTVQDLAKQDLKDKIGIAGTPSMPHVDYSTPLSGGMSEAEMIELLGTDDMDAEYPVMNSEAEAQAMAERSDEAIKYL